MKLTFPEYFKINKGARLSPFVFERAAWPE
jgi:hypothetical protein